MNTGRILREEGERYEPENVAEIPPLEGVVLHISAFISWYHKGKLIFYRDPDDVLELDISVQVKAPKRARPPKPRKGETWDYFKESERYLAYEASEPHEVDIQPKGNSMTQLFYTKKVLPKLIEELRIAERKTGVPHLLQEDNDPSYRLKSRLNYVQLYRQRHGINTLQHPGQSPDLNPIEAC
ncbi:MAG: hypothetical protein L6R38_003541 [Xanthoria sp. 2 TBL-2021]|nr:MAG: hypothetical protein L6R38_003541 [Xanthoria sp. 2 TBL-2021]